MTAAKQLESAIEQARASAMTLEERRTQRVSFAYGNARFEDDGLRRSTVEAAARKLPVSARK